MIPEIFAMTPREQEIAGLLVEGVESTEIAGQLGITVKAVKAHLGILYIRAAISTGAKRVRLVNLLSAQENKILLPQLGPRERQVAELAINGFTNREIAAQSKTSEQTIKNYLRIVFDKCGVWSRTELAARYRCDETKTETQSIA